MKTDSGRVVVIGGGAAGISCACELVERGLDVVLLEAGDDLGGRARSRWDEQAGMHLDNSQHVILGCCTETIDLLTRIGSIGQVRFFSDVELMDKSGARLKISSSPLPAPLHTLPSLLRTDYISNAEKWALARTLTAMQRRTPDENATADRYLKALGCPAGLISRVIEPIVVSALNEGAGSASAGYARMVLLKSLMGSRSGYHIGVPTAPLTEVLAAPARKYLQDRGCDTRLHTRATRLNLQGNRVRSVSIQGGEEIGGDVFVCAVTPPSLRALGYGTAGQGLGWHAILSVHLFFETTEFHFDQLCLVDEPFQWVFNKTADGMGFGYIQAVASAADDLADLPMTTLANLALKAAGKAAPEIRRAPVVRAIIYRGTRATFATAGSDACRPGSATGLDNLFLAGDWTDTGWPATIESAVRSGSAAAKAIQL